MASTSAGEEEDVDTSEQKLGENSLCSCLTWYAGKLTASPSHSPTPWVPGGSSMLVSMHTSVYRHTHTHKHTRMSLRPFLSASPLVFNYPSRPGNKHQVFTRRALASPWRLNGFMVEAILSSQQNKTKVLFGLSSPGYAHRSAGQASLISTKTFE